MRRAAVQSLSAVAHHKPALLEGALQPLLPLLYKQTVLDESLIRVVVRCASCSPSFPPLRRASASSSTVVLLHLLVR